MLKEKPLLVSLDLDETLYYRADSLDQVPYREPNKVLPGSLAPYLYLRPHADDLLRGLANHPLRHFGFFTASCGEGTDAAVEFLSELAGHPPLFYFDRSRVTFRCADSFGPYNYGPSREQVKDLKKVKRTTGFSLDDILAIDDKPVYPRQYGNALYVEEYVPGDTNDDRDNTLLRLHRLLTEYRHIDSVRHHFANKPRYFSSWETPQCSLPT